MFQIKNKTKLYINQDPLLIKILRLDEMNCALVDLERNLQSVALENNKNMIRR